VMARRSDLGASRGQLAMLMWEQTRFLATGSLWLAELHARDLAASGVPGANDAAVLMWFYALATTMTDGHQCASDGARDAHLATLRGAAFEPVLALVRTLPQEQLIKQRDTALKLEAAFAEERTDSFVCTTAGGLPAIRPAEDWHADAARTREILTKHLNAVCALVRSRPMTQPPHEPTPQAIAGTLTPPPQR
jgi:hypothetical protein